MPDLEGMLNRSHWLRGLARGLIDDTHLADDALQEARIKAWSKPPRDQQAGPAWLRQVMSNFVRMHFRGEGRRRKRERAAARPEAQHDEFDLETLELRREIVRALLALDEPFRATLILRYYEDLSSAEIARLEGIPAATVRVRLKRGLDRLREQLEDKREELGSVLFLIAGVEFPGSATASSTTSSTGSTTLNGTVGAVSTQASGSFRTRSAATVGLGVIVAVALTVPWLLGDPSRPGQAGVAGSSFEEPKTSRGTGSGVGDSDEASGSLTQRASSSSTGENAKISPFVGDAQWVQLRVVDPLGRPVADAQITVGQRRLALDQIADGYASTFEFLLVEPCPEALGKTSINGTRRISTAQLQGASLAVSAKGRLTARERPTHRQFDAGVYTVVLQPAVDAEIVVEAEGPEPVHNCAVAVTGRGGIVRYSGSSDVSIRHTSHDDVELVSFRASGFAAVQGLLTSPRHRQRLPSGRPAIGTVVNPMGQPVAGAVVSMRSTLWRGPAYTVTTDDLGRFETFGLAESGTLELHIQHSSYPQCRVSQVLPCADLGDIALETPHQLRGRVVDPEGFPCDGAAILAMPEGSFYSRHVVRTRSDADGRFQLPVIASGNYVLRAEHRDFAVAEQMVTTADERTTTLKLGNGATIVGRVQTERGRPVAGVPIKIGTIIGDELRGRVTYTDAAGRFRIEHLPSGSVQHRPRRRVLRWGALDGEEAPLASRSSNLVAELFLPYQLLSANDKVVPQPAHYGSRNTVKARVGSELHLVVAEPRPQPSIRFELTDRDGRRVRAFSNVLIVSPNDWTMKDFAGVDGQPFHLPNAAVLDDAQLTVMSRGYCWQTVRVDLRGERGGEGRVRFTLSPHFEQPPVLEIDVTEPMPLLAAPLLPGFTPLAALPIGSTDAAGRLVLTELGPGRYALCTPRDAEKLFGKTGKRRLAMSLDELHTVGHFTLSGAERQRVSVQLQTTSNLENAR